MSAEAVTWALGVELPDPGTKLVLVAMAQFADKQHHCFPGRPRLALMSCQSLEKATADLVALRARKLIADTGHRAGPSKRAIVWQLGVDGPVEPGAASPDWEPPF